VIRYDINVKGTDKMKLVWVAVKTSNETRVAPYFEGPMTPKVYKKDHGVRNPEI
jgi:hypothetical protein